ncbi:class I SAM-dependent methyltransferase [Streptomyces sp. NBC_00704]|uniref:class I SAM-dependent methyltransferase n=1 Tax=Streptomyces sp. NBC_00704 TaxID=2975809 RepID=UPI002E3082BC|nr:class I SAM-dependent methyltransferase [Streptomyces sp. NBC_00704]
MVHLVPAGRQPSGADYKFGDSDIAAQRLSTVAEVFAESSRSFLSRCVPGPVGLAVDLGCGPGHSTRLIAEEVRAERVVGLDRSVTFLARAEAGDGLPVAFRRHDVTTTPFPVAGPDLLYARLLLSHLRDTASVVGRWLGALAPNGRLLLDEVDSVESEHPVARDYQRVVEAMLRENGQRLDVGRVLGAMPDPPGTVSREDHVAEVRPTSRQVGRMFALNLRVWRGDPFLVEEFGTEWLDRLQQRLDMAASGKMELPVVWTMRQMVLVV